MCKRGRQVTEEQLIELNKPALEAAIKHYGSGEMERLILGDLAFNMRRSKGYGERLQALINEFTADRKKENIDVSK